MTAVLNLSNLLTLDDVIVFGFSVKSSLRFVANDTVHKPCTLYSASFPIEMEMLSEEFLWTLLEAICILIDNVYTLYYNFNHISYDFQLQYSKTILWVYQQIITMYIVFGWKIKTFTSYEIIFHIILQSDLLLIGEIRSLLVEFVHFELFLSIS